MEPGAGRGGKFARLLGDLEVQAGSTTLRWGLRLNNNGSYRLYLNFDSSPRLLPDSVFNESEESMPLLRNVSPLLVCRPVINDLFLNFPLRKGCKPK